MHLALPSFLSGNPQSVGIGCRGNCHLHRLAGVQYAEHGKFPVGCQGRREYGTGDCAGIFRYPWEWRLGRSSPRTGKPSTRVQEEEKTSPTAKAPSLSETSEAYSTRAKEGSPDGYRRTATET